MRAGPAMTWQAGFAATLGGFDNGNDGRNGRLRLGQWRSLSRFGMDKRAIAAANGTSI
ncbi:MAG: hypothetical protein HC777_02175 [Hyphomonadaceae bacterium]|nr:hypothetical protein [Hyphomonadaceae bacterium]